MIRLLRLTRPFRIGWRNFVGLLLTLACIVTAGIMSAQDTLRGYPPMLQWNGSVLISPVAIRWPNGGLPEYGELAWDANLFTIRTVANGGTNRGLVVKPIGTLTLGGANVSQMTMNGSATEFYNTNVQPALNDALTMGAAAVQWKSAYVSRSIEGSKSKTLTDAAAAVSFVRIAVPTNANMGGKLIYTATSTDGASGSLTSTAEYNFSGADIAGTVTCGISAQLGVATAYSRANTLVCTVTTVTSTTNCDLQATCTDNKAAAQTITLNWRLDMPITNTVVPQ